MSQLYFAFGSNMSRLTLRDRGVHARAAGTAVLNDHRLAFTLPSVRWTGRAADVLPAEGDEVWGVLWDLSDPNALDPYERRYNRVEFDVVGHAGTQPGGIRRVFAYTVKPELRAADEAPPAPAYLRRMVEGATEAGLPAGYVDFLQSCATA
jgi:hypothetical protein